MGGSLSLYLAATPVVSRRRYSSSFVSPSRYLRPRLHWPPFVGIKIGTVTAQYNAERQSKGYVWRSVCRECNMPTPIPSMTPEDWNQEVRRMTQTQSRRQRVRETTTPTHQEQQQSTDEVEALNDQISKIDRQVRELGSAAPVTAKQTRGRVDGSNEGCSGIPTARRGFRASAPRRQHRR